MEDHPLVTIGITAYNAAETIECAVRSALAQIWRPIEIVVVDDCSSDKTQTVLETLSASHPELQVFRNENNGGVAVARNRIVEEAKGEFIVFFDDDDESLPERVEAQLRRIVDYERNFADGAAVICHTVRRQRFPDGSECLIPTMGLRAGRPAPSGWAVAERVLLGSPLEDAYGACATCSQMARTSTYRALGGFDAIFRRSEDSDLVLRLAKAGGHFVGIERPLVLQNMTKSMDKSLAGEKKYMLMLLDKHRDVADRGGLYDFCRRWIDIKQAWLEGRKAAFIVALAGLALRHPLQTVRRLALAVPKIGVNRAFGRFHAGTGG